MGIPLIPDLGNSRSGNSTSLVEMCCMLYMCSDGRVIIPEMNKTYLLGFIPPIKPW